MMTSATRSRPLTPPLRRRGQVSWGDLAWLIWRQHRIAILAMSIGVVVVAGLFWWQAADPLGVPSLAIPTQLVMSVGAAVVAAFWGAPLLSTEYEQRTHLLAWAQDVSPMRWLAAKTVMLGAIAAVLWAILAVADSTFIHAIDLTRRGHNSALDFAWFDSWPPMQVAYVLFAFVLGIAVGAFTRRTVPSVGCSLLLYIGVHSAIEQWRPRYLPPLRYVGPPQYASIALPDPNDLVVGVPQTVDVAGAPASIPDVCLNLADGTTDVACAKANGVVATYADYQPADRLLTFHLIELGIYAVLTAALIAVIVYRVRANRVTA
jgi:hypothetical protein